MALEGVAAMVRAAVWLENRAGLETLSIGRGALDRKDSCTLELSGRQLSYCVYMDGGFVFLSAQSLDSCDPLERLLGVGDGPEGWKTICRLIAVLERSGISSLTPKPIQLGQPPGPDCWVIA
jgi:hypothetical protein